MSQHRFNSFEEFWPYYIAEHSQSATRALHALGTTASVACALTLIEKNKPATFDYPLWSFIADYKMIGLMVSGKMDAEVERVLVDVELI